MTDAAIELVAQELIDKVGVPDMPLALAIAKVAVAAERERCARIALNYGLPHRPILALRTEIAAAIRLLKEKH